MLSEEKEYENLGFEISLTALCLKNFSMLFQSEESKVPFRMAIGNIELMHECCPQCLHVGTTRMK